jgi:hypothetical protein
MLLLEHHDLVTDELYGLIERSVAAAAKRAGGRARSRRR